MWKTNPRDRSGTVIIYFAGMRTVDKNRAALTKTFKGKEATKLSRQLRESPKTITTAAGVVYRKSDLAKAAIPLKNTPKEGASQKEKAKSPVEEPKSKHQKNDTDQDVETESEEEDRNNPFEEQAKDLFQNSDIIVTSKETSTGGRLNLAVRRAKPNQGGSTMGCRKLKSKWQLSPKEKTTRKRLQ